MSLLRAYLLRPTTQRALSRKPGEKGFSLIELVVVIAVLAALAAIALPNFLGISDDAAVRAGQSAGVNYFKECQATWARGKRASTETFNQGARPDINEFAIFSYPTGVTLVAASIPTASTQDMECFATVTGTITAKKDIWIVPTIPNKSPKFVVRANGTRECISGTLAVGTNDDSYNTGCSGASGAAGAWQ